MVTDSFSDSYTSYDEKLSAPNLLWNMQDRWLRAAVIYCKHGVQKSSPLEYGTVAPPICPVWRRNLCTVNTYVSSVQHFVPTSDLYVSTTCLIYYSSHDEEDGRLVVWGIASVSSHLPLPPLSTAVGTERVSAVISTYQCGLTTKLFVPATSYGRATLGAKDVAKNSSPLSSSATPVSGCAVSRMWGFLGAECCAVSMVPRSPGASALIARTFQMAM